LKILFLFFASKQRESLFFVFPFFLCAGTRAFFVLCGINQAEVMSCSFQFIITSCAGKEKIIYRGNERRLEYIGAPKE